MINKSYCNTLVDNSSGLKMCDVLNDYLQQSSDYKEFCIATGYWDLPGLLLLLPNLIDFIKNGGKLKILIGKEPIVRPYQLKDLEEDDKVFPDFYIKRDIEQLNDTYRECAEFLLENCTEDENSPVEIRIYGQNEKQAFLHSKAYIFRNLLGTKSVGLIGSSNFTKKGLLDNSELNYLETTAHIVEFDNENSPLKGHKKWFYEKWNESERWNGRFIKEVLIKTSIGEKAQKSLEKRKNKLTPYEVYIKLLQHEFGEVINRENITELETYLPKEMIPLEYQFSAVNQCFFTMKKHGGFFLSDVVGLGKTVVGTLLIRQFLNAVDVQNRERKVLIITPPAIKSSWENIIERFDKDNTDPMAPHVTMITTGSIGKLIDDEEFEEALQEEIVGIEEFETPLDASNNYGLILIDESHKFRNSGTNMYQMLNQLIDDIYSNTGVYPYVGLLSATPQNNKPDDLKNQIYLFQRTPKESTLDKVEGRNLESFFTEINKKYDEIIKSPYAENWVGDSIEDFQKWKRKRDHDLHEISMELREKVLADVLVRRTRTDVKKYYAEDLTKQGIKFPEICGPHSLRYEMDEQLCHLFDETMNLIAPKPNFTFDDSEYLCYYRYRATEHLVSPENRKKYSTSNHDVGRVGKQLAKIMQISLVKRLESSFNAFKTSLYNLRRYTENMLIMLKEDCVFICPSLNINEELNTQKNGLSIEQCFDNIRKKIEKLNKEGRNEKNQNAEYKASDFKDEYKKLLEKDYQLIKMLCEKWQNNDYDPKLDNFKESINTVLFKKEMNTSGKLVIFTEALDTLKSLERAIKNKNHRPLVISAKNRKEKETIIRENFDANYEGEQKDDYDVIITTEVLAEGINLHRANVILNYDTPWNSTKLMQRIGRVNRIGSTNEKVHIFNFMPSAKGDHLINLVQKAHTKLQSFHTLFGEDSKIFSDAEKLSSYDDLKQFVEGEESPMQKYIGELKDYRDENPDRYQQIAEHSKALRVIVQGDNEAYFLVKNRKTRGLYIKHKNGDASPIPTLDFLEQFRANVIDKNELPFPENTAEIEEKVLLCFNRHFVKIAKVKESRPVKEAKKVIHELLANYDFNEKEEDLLNQAFYLLKKGDRSVAKIILAIDGYFKENALIKFTQEEAAKIISTRLNHILQGVEDKDGKAEILIGLITKPEK